MNNTLKTIIVLAVIIHIILFVTRQNNIVKWAKYFDEIGFYIWNKMNYDEMKSSYVYLYNYKGSIPESDNSLYQKIVAIHNKYNVFNIV